MSTWLGIDLKNYYDDNNGNHDGDGEHLAWFRFDRLGGESELSLVQERTTSPSGHCLNGTFKYLQCDFIKNVIIRYANTYTHIHNHV